VPGVSEHLARWRSAHFADLRYDLVLAIDAACDWLRGHLVLRWRFTGTPVELLLDWRPCADPGAWSEGIGAVRANGRTVPFLVRDEHVLIERNAFCMTGEQCVELEFETRIAEAGTPLTRYRDREDGSDYLYTLLVPADASALFPCMDQPDLKARFRLSIAVPVGWTVVANAPLASRTDEADAVRFGFEPTPPISTYLFAFAAGRFVEWRDEESGMRLFARHSQHARAQREAGEALRLNRACVRWFEHEFACPFPFAKYDLVLIPEFAYAGMEHAGATFLREDSVLFVAEPGPEDLLKRAQLIFHEASHQWFGDLVTMRWFDDLWLKEGFANLMAYKAARALIPDIDARIAWHRSKEIAYATDMSAGTTPIRQPLSNLAAAKSAYGNIVYHKAPAVLQLAESLLGAQAFNAAIRDLLARHAWSVADWSDLVAAMERASGRDLQEWARMWVMQPGMPRIECRRELRPDGRIAALTLNQSPTQPGLAGSCGVWPQRVEVVLGGPGAAWSVFPAQLDGPTARVDAAAGHRDADWVFANHADLGYGLFGLDARSRQWLLQRLPEVEDGFARALLWDALWQEVRNARVAPRAWADLLLRGLPRERDALTVSALLSTLQRVMRWYLAGRGREAMQQEAEALLRERMSDSELPALRPVHLRTFVAIASSPRALDDCERLLRGEPAISGVQLRGADRFLIARTLLAHADARGEYWLQRLAAEDGSDDGRRLAFVTAAARADPASKARCFEQFLDPDVPERWIDEAAGAFNMVEHESVTIEYLERALRALPRLRRERRIFFVNNWLAAFVGGQRSVRADEIVQGVLREDWLPEDLRRKLLEAQDGLARTLAVRSRYALGQGGG